MKIEIALDYLSILKNFEGEKLSITELSKRTKLCYGVLGETMNRLNNLGLVDFTVEKRENGRARAKIFYLNDKGKMFLEIFKDKLDWLIIKRVEI